MSLVIIGMNHRTAPLQIRERLSPAPCGDRQNPLPLLIAISDVREALYLATCNRVEILADICESNRAVSAIQEFLIREGQICADELQGYIYIHYGSDAVRHLFRVASSLDSLVMGEPQILGQLKEAYRQAVEGRATGVVLNKLLHHAFRVAKRVRTETGIASHAVSVSFAAVGLAKKIFGSLEGKTILLVGAGEMSELAARHLMNHGADKVRIANRTYKRALQMAEEFHGMAVPFENLSESLRSVDIVISSTGAPGYVIDRDMVAEALRRRMNRLFFLIDIAVPRDIDPAAGQIDNVYLYNIDDLQDFVDENRQKRQEEARKAALIIDEEVEAYQSWFDTLKVVPTIVSLREKLEGIVRGELERSGSWIQQMNDGERQRIENLIGAIVNKILHDPITGLKEESRDHDAIPYVATIRRLFRLDG
ncbi:MAG: glutamyl-tRNA reductase [Deltaproteobacteria bacterium]|nr:glutamyl-tRNA reductase [Deltaproteobacteria bacterium]